MKVGVLCAALTVLATDGMADVNNHNSNRNPNSRPFGLDIVGNVHYAGSDAASQDFQQNTLPALKTFIDVNLAEGMSINDSAYMLDPTKLELTNDTNARVYFIGEGAGYHNTLGFNVNGTGVTSGNPQIIFPDASSRNSYLDPTQTTVRRTGSAPLASGDFVNLGTLSSGSILDFFVIANGARGGENVYTTKAENNPDGINHIISYAMEDTPYLLIGFEDLYGGGDRDFNDLLFAVDIGTQNVQALQALVATPEPSSVVLGVSLGLIALIIKRKEDAKSSPQIC